MSEVRRMTKTVMRVLVPNALPPRMFEELPILFQCRDHLHCAGLAFGLLAFALHGFDTVEDFGDHEVQLRIRCGFQFAVGDDASDFAIDFLGEFGIFSGRELVFVNVVQRGVHRAANALHAVAQRCIGCPFVALVEA